MKKPTSKSASASRKISLRSGVSAKTDITGKTQVNGSATHGTFAGAVQNINNMSPDAFRATLVRLGISKRNRKLTAKYALRKKSSKAIAGKLKLTKYFQSGTRLAWVIDHRPGTVAVCHASGKPTDVLDEQGTLDGEQVTPGLRIATADFFRNVPR